MVPPERRVRPRAAVPALVVLAIAALAGTVAAGSHPTAAAADAPPHGAEAAPVAPPPDPVPERPVGTDTLELMRVAGIDDEIERLAGDLVDALVDGFASADPAASPERARLAAGVAARLFSLERVHDAVARRVGTMLAPDARARLIAHHGSALGRRALAAETARAADADPDEIDRFVAALRDEPGHEARLRRFASLMAETGADRLVARLSSDLQLAAMHGALVADPATAGASFEGDVADLEWQRGIVRFMLARELPALLAHAYADLSDADVDALVEASRDGEQRQLLEALHAGVHDAVLAAGERFGPRYRRALTRAELPDGTI